MIIGEFRVNPDAFILGYTLRQLPGIVLEIERVVASGKLLTPYFWVATEDVEAFESVAKDDLTIDDLQQIDEFDDRALYRGDWTENIDALLYAYQDVGAAIMEATGTEKVWELRIQFESQRQLDDFQSFCRDYDIDFDLQRLYEASDIGKGAKFGLTEKQHEAATRAWEMGYFDSPREVSLSDVADDLGISTQAVSDRLRRAEYNLLAETLIVSPISGHDRKDGKR